jgi:hypothetical protein
MKGVTLSCVTQSLPKAALVFLGFAMLYPGQTWFALSAPVVIQGDHEEHFRDAVLPVLSEHCLKCHGAEPKLRGGLSLVDREAMMRGGDSGPAVDLNEPSKSLLLSMVSYKDEDHEMPPNRGKLSSESIQALSDWIEKGLVIDSKAMSEAIEKIEGAGNLYDNSINEKTRQWWAFLPLQKPNLPAVGPNPWSEHPVDRLIEAKLSQASLLPNEPADRASWIRRAYYDLTGLPPTFADVEAFLQDPSKDAYEKVVDHLLASERYGEKWARHWLDLVRYAETNGYERDNPKPETWRYRDYVISSFNEDKPYDRFVREQIAGDELDTVTPETLIATGFHRLGIWDDEPVDADQAYYDGMDDVISTTGQAFMGLTIGCARCHEHKIDPIPHEDYYRMLAFFNNTFKNIREGQFKKSPYTLNTTRVIAPDKAVQEHDALRQALQEQTQQLEKQVEAYETRIVATFSKPEKEDARDDRTRRTMIRAKKEKVLTKAELQDLEGIEAELKALKERKLPSLDRALVIQENGPKPAKTHVLLRGNAHSLGQEVQPGFPAILGFDDPVIPPPTEGAQSSGRRRVFADWLVDSKNPLTARVIANRVWQFHFGRGICRTPSNFGQNGELPTHPELIDWLATYLMEHKWSLKRLHKHIMLSKAYQMSSQSNPRALEQDPENNLFWRFDMRRLTAEEIRDSVIHLTGNLNLQMGGPSIYTPVPDEILATASRPDAAWGKSSPEQQNRRSVYVFMKRSLHEPVLKAFDMADTDSACAVRFTTTVPTQALTMLNSAFLNDQAQSFAARLEAFSIDSDQQIAEGIRLVTSRQPSESEIALGRGMLAELVQELKLTHSQALQRFALMLMNLNEFLYLD